MHRKFKDEKQAMWDEKERNNVVKQHRERSMRLMESGEMKKRKPRDKKGIDINANNPMSTFLRGIRENIDKTKDDTLEIK